MLGGFALAVGDCPFGECSRYRGVRSCHSAPDKTLPSKQVIRDAQEASRTNPGTLAAGAASFMTNVGQVSLDADELFRLLVNGRAVLCIPGGATQLQVRLMVCVHLKEAGHRGAVATLQRLSEYYCWFCMEEHVAKFVKQCLHCMDSKAGEKVPRPLGETVHGTSPGGVVHFDYLYKWDAGGRWPGRRRGVQILSRHDGRFEQLELA